MPDAARLRQTPPALWFLLLVALVSLALAPRARADEMRLSVLGGAMASLSTEADTAVEPLVTLSVSAPLADARRPALLLIDLALAALPGQAVSLEDPQTFNSIEARVALTQRPWDSLLFGFYAGGGFATRLPGDPTPRERTARWAEAGVRLADDSGNGITVGGGYDERLDGSYQPALELAGSVRLPVELGKVAAYLTGRAILGIDVGQSGAPRRDVVQIGVCIGGGSQ